MKAHMEGGIGLGIRSADEPAPRLEVHLVPSNAKPGGVGEPGTAATAPALPNAIFGATGKRIRALPPQKALQVSA